MEKLLQINYTPIHFPNQYSNSHFHEFLPTLSVAKLVNLCQSKRLKKYLFNLRPSITSKFAHFPYSYFPF